MPLLSVDSWHSPDSDILQVPIYRTFPIGYAHELISEGRLVLVRPTEWDDPYENLLLKYFENQDKTGLASHWHGASLFGSCWTRIPESDFAWRVYLKEGEVGGVIVESTIEKLLSALHGWGELYAMRDCFVGQVSYHSSGSILDFLTSDSFQRSNDSSDTAHHRARGLLLKRPEFEHEREVRAIIECWDLTKRRSLIRESKYIDVPIDPNCFIDGITIDPRIDQTKYQITKSRLRDAGYEGSIQQSELYRLPWEETARLAENCK